MIWHGGPDQMFQVLGFRQRRFLSRSRPEKVPVDLDLYIYAYRNDRKITCFNPPRVISRRKSPDALLMFAIASASRLLIHVPRVLRDRKSVV